MSEKIAHPIEDYLPLLITGDLSKLLDLFVSEPFVNDQRLGQVKGVEEFKNFVQVSHEWLTQRQARTEAVALTQTDVRAIAECKLHLVQDGKAIDLPVALVSDVSGGQLTFLRTYYSMYPILGKHVVRPSFLPAISDEELNIPDVVGRYLHLLPEGNTEAILQLYEPEGYVREPSGGEFIHQGLEKLRQFYQLTFSNGGGVPLEHCSVTDDGVQCAVEYNVVAWGRTQLPPQAGAAVYQRASNGSIAAIRIYDDADPPIGH